MAGRGDNKHAVTLWLLFFIAVYGFFTVWLPLQHVNNNALTNPAVQNISNAPDTLHRLWSQLQVIVQFHTSIWWLDMLVFTPVVTYLAIAWISSLLPSGG